MTDNQMQHADAVEIIQIRTVSEKNDPSSGLSFFEAEHDIPFSIGQIEVLLEGEAALQRGRVRNRQMLFCPYGAVAVAAGIGSEQRRVVLDRPSVGLILHPGVWRELFWLEPGSVLCAAAEQYHGQTGEEQGR